MFRLTDLQCHACILVDRAKKIVYIVITVTLHFTHFLFHIPDVFLSFVNLYGACYQCMFFVLAGQASPVLLLTLRDRLEGLEGALLRSLLDIDCLSNLIDQKDIVDPGLSCINGVEDIQTPTPSLESTDPEHKTDQDCTQPDREKNTAPQTQDEPQEESELEPEKVPEDDAGSQLTPEDEQKEQEVEPPAEVSGAYDQPQCTRKCSEPEHVFETFVNLLLTDKRRGTHTHIHSPPC